MEEKDKLEKLLEKKKKELEKNSWQEELSELERQWKVRYQIAKHYGEEIAKVQFPNLKGESYFDEIKNRYNALDKKQSSVPTVGIATRRSPLGSWCISPLMIKLGNGRF